MKIWERLERILGKISDGGEGEGKGPLLLKYQSFRELLAQNNSVLEQMADIEERISGPPLGGTADIEAGIRAIIEGVRRVVDVLNLMSGNAYARLNEIFGKIAGKIGELLEKEEIFSEGGSMPSGQIAGFAAGRIPGYDILIDSGIVASRGIGSGKAYVVKAGKGLKDFPPGGVLVAGRASAKYARVLPMASAVITDVGGKTAHLATLARELRVPMMVDARVATKVIREGAEITVDAINNIVYAGRVTDFPVPVEKKKSFPVAGSGGDFAGILKLVIPLNLVDPDDDMFSPEFCETLHDIVRFAHQKAMQEMFDISEGVAEGVAPVKLAADIPLAVYVADLGGGIAGKRERPVPSDVLSVPFRAFLKGLSSESWPEPRHVDVKGFMGMMAHAASLPEEELARMAEKSFSVISGEYMNFSIRLGYHLSVVEAYAHENINDNYIRFFFKGGGADIERRLRRVSLIRGVLELLDFDIRVTEDVIDAVIKKNTKEQIEEKLEILGELTVYTKQIDAIMFEEGSVELHMDKFMREHAGRNAEPG